MITVPRILIMGAINQDETARVSRLPVSGETIVTGEISLHSGGKGANQAAAAATAGYDVSVQMLGAVGDDAAGDHQLDALAAAGVDVSLVRRVIGTSTGRAHITVAADGANSIVVGLGANAYVSPVNLRGAERPDLVVAQTEIGVAPTDALAEFAAANSARLVVNNGPALALAAETLQAADPLIVNEPEAIAMMNGEPESRVDVDGALALATQLRLATAARSVVITLGAAGSVVADDTGVKHVSAVPVRNVIDTTGAGDTFIGVLAAALATGATLAAATEAASRAGARAVGWEGARAVLSPIAR